MGKDRLRRGDSEREGVLFDYDGGDFVVVGDDHVALQVKKSYRTRFGWLEDARRLDVLWSGVHRRRLWRPT